MNASIRLGKMTEAAPTYWLRVVPLVHGGFGVFANAVLIGTHRELSDAEAHCQRLRDQQSCG
jgi:hypothetical protein